MEKTEEAAQAETGNGLQQVLETVWTNVILGESKWNPEKSCFQLADEYRSSGKTPRECAENFIAWQTAKAGAAGFALGLPGLVAMPFTVPADLASVSYLQLRMVAVIGLLFGWDAHSDKLRTTAFFSLIGSAAGETVRDVSIKAGTGWARIGIKKIPIAALNKINHFLPGRNFIVKGLGPLVPKAGSKIGINLAKCVPLLGGVVGGGVDAFVTRQIGGRAIKLLENGPSVVSDGTDGPVVDGEADVVFPVDDENTETSIPDIASETEVHDRTGV